MPRIPRKYIETTYFHIMAQGNNKSFIFSSSIDIKYYIKIMYQFSEELNIKIISYCVMGNHVHILLKVKDIHNLSKYMQKLNTKYGIYYNKKYNRVGHVFRDRFRSEGIYNDNHLYNCINYIYNNPVKAGICKLPEDYLYSNYKKIPINIEGYYNFIDTEEEKELEHNQIINNYLKTNSLSRNSIVKDKSMLKKLVYLLHIKYGISLREISKILNIGRETIRKLIIN